jgi:hypothetical protein
MVCNNVQMHLGSDSGLHCVGGAAAQPGYVGVTVICGCMWECIMGARLGLSYVSVAVKLLHWFENALVETACLRSYALACGVVLRVVVEVLYKGHGQKGSI